MILPVYLLFAVNHLTSSLHVDIPLPTYEFVQGDTGVIPCNFQPQNANSQSVIITWSAYPDNPHDSDIIIETCYYTAAGGGSVQEDVEKAYTGRASVQANIPLGRAPLTLKSLTSQDSRVYQCDVKIPGDSKGKLSDTTTVVVLVNHLTSSLNVDIPQSTYEFARGDTGVIPCNFQPQNANSQSVIITWSAYPDNPDDSEIIMDTYYYSTTEPIQEDINEAYTGRASIWANVPQGLTLLILKSLTPQDSRVYQCDVRIPGDNKGKLYDTTTVVVLVAPSKPICAIQGRAEFNENINLTCHSDEGTPVPTYKWQRYDVNNNSRPNPPKSKDVNGVLSLFNISEDTSGYYICMSANKIRYATCNLTLAVMPPSMNYPSTKGITEECAGNCQWCT